MYKQIITLLCALFLSIPLIAQSKLSLNDYGLRNAKNGVQRAHVLYEAQTDAIKKGTTVDYSGIKRIELEISKDFKSIPLTGKDDFKGVEFVVKNDAKNVVLFDLTRKAVPITVDQRMLDGRCFKSIPELQKGEHLLVIQDNNLWVDNRVGHDHGHTRKDVLLIKNGRSQNRVIASYNNPQSSPSCAIIEILSESCQIGNFTLTRAAGSKCKTYCMKVQGVAHLIIENIVINTPENELSGDKAIRILDCADVTLKDIIINNTYSQSNKYGYGININNAWNTHLVNVKGNAKWGILGNNNLSDTYLLNCQLNRFDIHCYGKNVFMTNCSFNGGEYGWYCGGSSIYGVVQYDRCSFENCTPFAMGHSYKTAVGADVVFNDCVFNVTKKRHSIVRTRVLNSNLNPRHGLSKKCLPNIEINNMTINVPKGIKKLFLYDVGNVTYSGSVGYITNVKINGLIINCESSDREIDFKFIDTPVRTDKPIDVVVSNLKAINARVDPVISVNNRNNVKFVRSSLRSVEPSTRIGLITKQCTIEQ